MIIARHTAHMVSPSSSNIAAAWVLPSGSLDDIAGITMSVPTDVLFRFTLMSGALDVCLAGTGTSDIYSGFITVSGALDV